jgi:phage baseplate assembly protein V
VAILCPGGSLSQGVIIGSLYSSSNPAPGSSADQSITKYSDGTTITYDRAAHTLAVQAVGAVTINIQGNATLTAQAVAVSAQNGLTLTGALTVDGDLTLNGKVAGTLKVAGNVRATGAVAQSIPLAQL